LRIQSNWIYKIYWKSNKNKTWL